MTITLARFSATPVSLRSDGCAIQRAIPARRRRTQLCTRALRASTPRRAAGTCSVTHGVSSSADEDVLAHPQTARRLQVVDDCGLRLGLRSDGPRPARAAHHPADHQQRPARRRDGPARHLRPRPARHRPRALRRRRPAAPGQRQGQPRDRVRPAQPDVESHPAPVVHLLRPLAHRPADEPGDERRPERAHVPRLRPRLLRHQHRHDGRHLGHPPRHGLAAGAALPRLHAAPAAGDDPLQPAPEADPQGRAAEDRRRDGDGRGERGRQPHRAHLRA